MFWDESVDSPDRDDSASSFIGGQVSYAKPRMLSENQAAQLQDVEIAITGQVSTRFGTAQVGGLVGSGTSVDAIIYYNTVSNTYEAALSNGNLWKLSGGVWSSIQVQAYTDTPSLVQGNNNLYWAGGTDIFQWNGTTATNVSGDGVAAGPRNASILLWHMNRLVAAGPNIKDISTDPVQSDQIFFSNFLDATTWGVTKLNNQLRVGAGDGLAIISIVPWNGFNLAVFKRHSCWVVNADPTLAVSDMPIQLVHPTIGCVARKTAVQVGADILFLSDDGVRSLSAVAGSEQQQSLSVPLSYPVNDIIQRINWSVVNTAASAAFWRQLYILMLPLDSSTTANFALVYNTVTQSWVGLWTNIPANCFATREVSGVTHLWMGLNNTNKAIEYLDYVSQPNWVNATFQDYNGNNVNPAILTRAMTFGDMIGQKIAIGGEIEWNNSSGTLTVTPILDETNAANLPAITMSSGGFVFPITPPWFISFVGLARQRFDLMSYGEFRQIQFQIVGSGAGRKELRQVTVKGINRPTLVGSS